MAAETCWMDSASAKLATVEVLASAAKAMSSCWSCSIRERAGVGMSSVVASWRAVMRSVAACALAAAFSAAAAMAARASDAFSVEAAPALVSAWRADIVPMRARALAS